MPAIGEIRRAKELGKRGYQKFIWYACEICHKERWELISRGKPDRLRCNSCAQKAKEVNAKRSRTNSYLWKGGRITTSRGYTMIYLPSDDFYYPMAGKSGYVMEHRLVMAKSLGRCLASWEKIHHKGIRYTGIENKSDNLIDNLKMTTAGSHIIEHNKGYKDGFDKGYFDGKDKRIRELQEENRALKVELKRKEQDEK